MPVGIGDKRGLKTKNMIGRMSRVIGSGQINFTRI